MKTKKKSSPAYVSSKSRQTAERMLEDKLRSEGYTRGRSDMRAPSFKLTQDKKSGEYRYRKMAKGGKFPDLNKDGKVTRADILKGRGVFKDGGKTKSKVNEAGNYTKPGMRKRLFERIKAGSKGGNPGQWSARKAQLLASQYKKKGGGYKN